MKVSENNQLFPEIIQRVARDCPGVASAPVCQTQAEPPEADCATRGSCKLSTQVGSRVAQRQRRLVM